jgi:hypothetical protein
MDQDPRPRPKTQGPRRREDGEGGGRIKNGGGRREEGGGRREERGGRREEMSLSWSRIVPPNTNPYHHHPLPHPLFFHHSSKTSPSSTLLKLDVFRQFSVRRLYPRSSGLPSRNSLQNRPTFPTNLLPPKA